MKRAIIVGGTSGIGRNLAEILATTNYIVGITGRRIENLEEIKALNPDKIVYEQFDVNETNTIHTHLNTLTKKLGGLDLLIISSGTGEINRELDYNIEKNVIDTNVSGFTAVADWAFQYFYKQQQGHLVGISSISGLRGNSDAPSYSATKAFQINYLDGLRIKAYKSKLPIHITDVRPGFVDTKMAKGEGLFWVAPVHKASKQIVNAITKKKEIVYITKRWRIVAYLLKILPNIIYNKL